MKLCVSALTVLLAAFTAPAAEPGGRRTADPAATRLLAEARAARAVWHGFPGFRAEVEINNAGQVLHGRVQVNRRGKVTLEGIPDGEAASWARHTLASAVGHRLDDVAGEDTPCVFVGDSGTSPLGREVRALSDEFQSTYRIRDRQLVVVSRHSPAAHFSITVLENRVNAEKKYLPVCYVVNSWDSKTGALESSASYRQGWKRVGDFDLPSSVLVVTAGPGGRQEARSVRLAHFQLSHEGDRK